MLVPLAGAALAVLGFVWPEYDAEDELPAEEVTGSRTTPRPLDRRAELNRLIRLPSAATPMTLPSVDFHGVVRDSKTGAALDETSVDFAESVDGQCEEGVDWQGVTWDEAGGGFTIPRDELEEPGPLCLSLTRDGYADDIITVARSKWPVGRPGLAVRLAPQATLRGRVLDLDGKPRPEVDVSVYLGDERATDLTTTTEKDGTYEVKEIDAGTYLVTAESYDTAYAAFAEVKLGPGEVRRLDLQERAVKSLTLQG